ncbi:MAG: hypothetical protein HC893_16175 [Chloroflexaceae bacterium]|nr:hypothetical protein [Chloroflexaceae bacterium]
MSDYEYARLLPSHQVDATTGMPVVRFHPAWLFWGYLLLLATIEANHRPGPTCGSGWYCMWVCSSG